MAYLIVAGGGIVLALLARRCFGTVTVIGDSMAPTFHDGDHLLLRRVRRMPARGDAVVFRTPDGPAGMPPPDPPWLVKRVVGVPGDPVPETVRPAVGERYPTVPMGAMVVLGDGERSLDSRHFGFVPTAHVLGVVIRRIDLQPGAR